jgi:hypothetical protein
MVSIKPRNVPESPNGSRGYLVYIWERSAKVLVTGSSGKGRGLVEEEEEDRESLLSLGEGRV